MIYDKLIHYLKSGIYFQLVENCCITDFITPDKAAYCVFTKLPKPKDAFVSGKWKVCSIGIAWNTKYIANRKKSRGQNCY